MDTINQDSEWVDLQSGSRPNTLLHSFSHDTVAKASVERITIRSLRVAAVGDVDRDVDADHVQLLLAASAPQPEAYSQPAADTESLQQLLDSIDLPAGDLSQLGALVRPEDIIALLEAQAEGGDGADSTEAANSTEGYQEHLQELNSSLPEEGGSGGIGEEIARFLLHNDNDQDSAERLELQNLLASLNTETLQDLSLQVPDIVETIAVLQGQVTQNGHNQQQENDPASVPTAAQEILDGNDRAIEDITDEKIGPTPNDPEWTLLNSSTETPATGGIAEKTQIISVNEGDAQHPDNNQVQTSNTIQGHGTNNISEMEDFQFGTDDGNIDLESFDEEKLIALQNAIKEFGGEEAFGQLLQGPNIQATPNGTSAFLGPTSSSPDQVNVMTQTNSAGPDASDVNVEELQQEAVFMSIGRLLDTTNVDMSSFSLDTQEQLAWLVQQLNALQEAQDDDGDDGDERNKSTTTPDYRANSFSGGDNLARIRRMIQSPKRMSAKNKAEQARIREENRERKKRWRESNQDRNKDNDLRCRVTKRAAKLYGPVDTEEKKTWMEAEFLKRKEKREAKERARYQDDLMPASQCFSIYPQQHHHHSGGSSVTFSSGLQPLSRSMINTTGAYLDFGRNRASSVAESTSSAGDIGDGDDTSSALKLLSDPEAAQKLLQNSEAMELLSGNPEVLAFLQAVIEGKEGDMNPGGEQNYTTKMGSLAENYTDSTSGHNIPNYMSPFQQDGTNLSIAEPRDNSPSPVINSLLNLTEEELELKLAQMDPSEAEKALNELLMLQEGANPDENCTETVQCTTPNDSEMEIDPDVQRILDSPALNHVGGLDLTLVNDRLITLSTHSGGDGFSFQFNQQAGFPSSSLSHGLDIDNNGNSNGELPDISQKLLNALQGMLGDDEQPALPPTPTSPIAPPPTPSKTKKRPAPPSSQSLSPRKRQQQVPQKATTAHEISPDAARAFADLLHNSGIDLNKFGITTTTNPPSSSATGNTTYQLIQTRPPAIPDSQTANYTMPGAYSAPVAVPRTSIPRPPPHSMNSSNGKPMTAAAAHAASFGNSAGMNSRLMPPPTYRPPNLGIGYGGITPMPTVSKKKPDERIVKAMGFPPLLAGIKKKTPS
ncbi:hypothetical protein DFH27DRAFT_634268 [Peziza echinospora]|nr:hypothetical protein DFH27DRAFT_634268 [Peziza echinospora]